MANRLITIDGSKGEGGGQILRTSLALSMITGKAFHIERVRAGREKPGLLRQHLTAVSAAASICDGDADGATIGSSALTFTPGRVKAGDYKLAIGSAGSTTLVLQTILPALMIADAPSTLTLEGGTHNPFAPPLDFIERAFLPVIRTMGLAIDIAFERAGFYPAGGGRFSMTIAPTPREKLTPFRLNARGETVARTATAIVAGLSGDIAKRELFKVQERLGWPDSSLKIRQLPAEWGPGNVLMLEIASERVTELFTSFGQRSITAEAVAEQAVQQARHYLAADAPVGPYLADQLLIPLALAGSGSFVTSALSNHTKTNLDVIARFLEVRIDVKNLHGERVQIGCE